MMNGSYNDHPDSKNVLSFSLRDGFSLLFSYLIAYLVVHIIFHNEETERSLLYFLPCLTVLFAFWVLYVFRGRKRTGDWIVCILGCAGITLQWMSEYKLIPLKLGFVWQGSILPTLLFCPALASLFVLEAAGLTCFPQNGRLFPLDLFRSLFKVPLCSFSFRLRTLLRGAKCLRSKLNSRSRSRLIYGLCTAGISLVFLVIAVALLRSADTGFDELIRRWFSAFRFEGTEWPMILFLLSLLPGALLFGLVEGTRAADCAQLKEEQNNLVREIAQLRRLPAGVWNAVLCLFSAVYLLFFGIQAAELIPAFMQNLAPGSFTMADYAKQGFFEMCALSALNFSLLAVDALTSDIPVRQRSFSRVMFTLLLAENILFILLASLKLFLYLQAFGFTPLRMQGAFGITVLLAGCILSLIWLHSGRHTARIFVRFTLLLLTVTLFV